MQKAMLTFVKSSNMNSQNGNGNRRKSSTPQRRIKQQQRFNSSQNDTPPKRTTRYEFKIQNLASNPDSMSLVRGRAVGFAVTKDTDGEGGCPAVPVSSKWRKPAAGRASLAPSVSYVDEEEPTLEDGLSLMAATPGDSYITTTAQQCPSLPIVPPSCLRGGGTDSASKSYAYGTGSEVIAHDDGSSTSPHSPGVFPARGRGRRQWNIEDTDGEGAGGVSGEGDDAGDDDDDHLHAYTDGSDGEYEGACGTRINGALSLSSWLSPPPDSTATRKTKKPRRKRPTSSDNGSSTRSRSWVNMGVSQAKGMAAQEVAVAAERGGSSISSLSAWLEPPKKHSKAESKRGEKRSRGETAANCGKKRGRAVDIDANTWDEGDRGGDGGSSVEGGEDWISERLGGFDPDGVARAKDGWADRERRNLTSTDVALGAKRKSNSSKGNGRGWRTRAGGSKVFVAPTRGRAPTVATGQAAFRMSLGGGSFS